MNIRGKRILVLGAGCSGIAAAVLASSEGGEVIVLDSGSPKEESLRELKACPVEIITGRDALVWHGKADLAIFSPGVSVNSPLGLMAHSIGCECVSELGFGASFLQCPILAVTGTNGKTTTVEMLEHCLNDSGHNAIAAGNIGYPLSRLPLQREMPEYVVAEVSSFQLELPEYFNPDVAAILNITPDHLNRHGSMEAYADAKFAILNSTKKEFKAVINKKLQIEYPRDTLYKTLFFSFSGSSEADFTVQDGALVQMDAGKTRRLVELCELPFSGTHNYENALAALAVTHAAGLKTEKISQQLKSFHTGAHRLENVAQFENLTFIDDSKATNVDALVKALNSVAKDGRPIALIAGGLDKGCSLQEALPVLQQTVKRVFLIGFCGSRLLEDWGTKLEVHLCKTLEEAVFQAACSMSGCGIVLLSPACASHDMFQDYAQRGDAFKAAALQFCNQNK